MKTLILALSLLMPMAVFGASQPTIGTTELIKANGGHGTNIAFSGTLTQNGIPVLTNANAFQPATANGTNWSNLSTQNIANLIGATGALSTAVANLNGATGALSTAVANLNGATGALNTAVANLQAATNQFGNTNRFIASDSGKGTNNSLRTPTIASATASRAAIIDAQGILSNSVVTATELALLSGKTSVADNSITNGLGTDKVNIQSGAANSLTSTNETSLASDTNQVAQRILSSSGYGRSTNTFEVLGPVGAGALSNPATNLVYIGYGIITNAWPAFRSDVTWSNSAVTFDAFVISAQNKGMNSASTLLNVGTNNGATFSSKLQVRTDGSIFFPANTLSFDPDANSSALTFQNNGTDIMALSSTRFILMPTIALGWNASAINAELATALVADSPGVLAQRARSGVAGGAGTNRLYMTNSTPLSANPTNGTWLEFAADNALGVFGVRALVGTNGVGLTPLALSSGTTNPALRIETNNIVTVRTGVNSDGGGLKHARVTTGSVGIGSTALVTVTWTTAFADANYTTAASVLDSTTTSLSLSIVHEESKSASAVTYRILNNSATTALTGTLNVIAIHD